MGENPKAATYLRGIWNFQKDSMFTTSRPNAFSEGFSKNQIEIIKRIIRQEMRKNRDYQNYDYYDN